MRTSRNGHTINLQKETLSVNNWIRNLRPGLHPLGPIPDQPINPKAKCEFSKRELWMYAHAHDKVLMARRRNRNCSVDEQDLAAEVHAYIMGKLHFYCCDGAVFWRSVKSVELAMGWVGAANTQKMASERNVAVQAQRAAEAAAAQANQSEQQALQAAAQANNAMNSMHLLMQQQAQVQAQQAHVQAQQAAQQAAQLQAQAQALAQQAAVLQNNGPRELANNMPQLLPLPAPAALPALPAPAALLALLAPAQRAAAVEDEE